MNFICAKCKRSVVVDDAKVIHSGFASQGYLYCDSCPAVLVFNAYDKKYVSLIGEKNPWILLQNEQKIVEKHLIACQCGGRFTFDAKPRCLHCNAEIPEITPLKGTEKRPINYVILKNVIDGDKTVIWNRD